MAKKIITFEVDQSKLFDMMQTMNGDCGPFGERVAFAMMTGKTGMATDIGLGVYGIVFEGQKDVYEPDEPDHDHDWVRDGHIARCAKDGCEFVRAPQGDEREMTETDQS